MIKRLIKRSQYPLQSYSQSGEDIIARRVLLKLGIKKPTYLDIGANYPVALNNTYLLYKNGSRGVLVEPEPALYKRLKSKRKKDIVLNIGIGIDDADSADFYIMENKYLNTFDKESAESLENKIIDVVKVPLMNINRIIREHFKSCPDFISLDTEGIDLQILRAFDFNSFRPAVFCIETINYTEDNSEVKQDEIIELMKSHNYLAFADTYINTVFVDKDRWRQRGR